MFRPFRRAIGASLATLVAGSLAFLSPASAGKPAPSPTPADRFGCRASLVRVDGKALLDYVKLEPVVANKDGDPCESRRAGVLNETLDLKHPNLRVALKLLWADTYAKTGHKAVAETGVAELRIELYHHVIEAAILTAEAGGFCSGGSPVLHSSSNVLHLKVDGIEVDVPYGQQHKEIELLDEKFLHLATLHLNETVNGQNQVTRQALRLDSYLADVVIAEAIADVHGSPCAAKPPKPPRHPRGWMTGGGRLENSRVTHGMRLECLATDGPSNLQVNWPDNGFHLKTVEANDCDDTALDPAHPPADFDTMVGRGTGRCRNGGSATVEWTKITDAGEPGVNDELALRISGDCSLNVSGKLDHGNHQAHRRYA